jgi:hypothetical protein
MYLSQKVEKRITGNFCLFLIIINFIALYFIIDLLSYDEIVGYLSINEMKSRSARPLAFLFLAANLVNLLFACVSLIWLLVSNGAIRGHESK